MRRWLAVGLFASTAACSLIVGTDGLSGGQATSDGGPMAIGDASPESTTSDAPMPTDACVGTGCVAPPIPPCDGPCTPVLIAMEVDLRGIAADESGVYWTAPSTGDVKRANVDGTGVTTLYDGNQAPALVALDDTFVYWTEPNSGLVSAVRKDANKGTRVTLSGQPDVFAIAVSAGEVFFQLRTMMQVLHGSSALTTATVLTTGTTKLERIAVDSQFVYLGATGPANRVQRAPRGTATAAPTDLSTRYTDFRDFAIDGTRVYSATGDDGSVASENIDGSGSGALTYASGEATPSCVAVDDTYVYWANFGNGLIRRSMKAGGGAVETLASGQTQPFAIAVNSRAVYWLNTDGSVMTLRKP